MVNLRPAPPATRETTPAGETGEFFRPADNPGFSHAPSLGQAATVAVLRSGHLTHADGEAKDLLAIDLSSERVRLAEWLLDGVRQGQPLGALLGYRFERRLHEAGLDYFISFFREAAPLVAKKLEAASDASVAGDPPAESIAARNVVDGLVLHRLWKEIAASGGAPGKLFDRLAKKPDDKLFEAWEGYIKALSSQLDDEQRRLLKKQIINFASLIAGSAGGFLGIGKVSGSEQKVLARIDAAFGH